MKKIVQVTGVAATVAQEGAMKFLHHLYIVMLATVAFSPPARAADEPVTTFVIERGTTQLRSVSFSSDSQQLVTRQASGQVQIFEVARNAKIADWLTASGPSQDFPAPAPFNRPQVVFLPDSMVLAAVGKDVTIHDRLNGNILRRLESPPEPVTQITVAPNGVSVVGTLKDNRRVVFWNPADGRIIHGALSTPNPNQAPFLPRNPFMNSKPPTSVSPGFCRAFSRDGSLFAVGLEFAQIDLWDLKNEKFLNTLQSSDAPGRSSSSRATSVAFLADDRLAAVFNEQELSIFALNGKSIATADQPVNTLLRHASMSKPDSFEIRSLAVSGNGRRIAVAGIRMGKRPGVFAPKGDFVFDVPMHGEIQIWNADDKKLLKTIQGKPTEKFALVALDATGGRVDAVTTGVLYTSRMTGAMQQGEELAAKGTPRVYVWDVKEK